jgi:heme exporter protein C
MKKYWWKYLASALVIYSVIYGFLGPIPRQPILNETLRNVYFHVPMWFGMMALMIGSAIFSIKYLKNGQINHDIYAVSFAYIAIVYGILGFITGAIWGNFTWGDPLPKDPKLIAVEVGMLIYAAYFVLRGSFEDEQKKARLSAVYNIFAFAAFMPLVWILPRLTDSLHPGNGGNPAFGKYDMDNSVRMVFYPSVIGWTLLGFWIATLRIRIELVKHKLENK